MSAQADSSDRIFREPWEARIFALVLALRQRGAIEWQEFQDQLIKNIASAEKKQAQSPYYEHWVTAAEMLVVQRGILEQEEIGAALRRLEAEDRTVRWIGAPAR